MEQRQQQKLKMQAEIKRINDENQKQKAGLLAQEKLADQMVMEFTKKKMVGTRFLGPLARNGMSVTGKGGPRTEGTSVEGSRTFILRCTSLVQGPGFFVSSS